MSQGDALEKYLGALDQGTSSTRFVVFDRSGNTVARAHKEHRQIYPRPGWVEHDAEEIWRCAQEVMTGAVQQCGLRTSDFAAIGITNQRETRVSRNDHGGSVNGISLQSQ